MTAVKVRIWFIKVLWETQTPFKVPSGDLENSMYAKSDNCSTGRCEFFLSLRDWWKLPRTLVFQKSIPFGHL
ncbi:hypothetical protein WICPIJ_004499 [Wickerhamomyces pijperi]|uniref:Uncharacterized protein n=1 Tax=Wickerhamomyces pijperi TaxID=599730 RepID=A0A9P8TLZ7_WICPI|nr:hypothetical protein WICPIJ_004499 [Wickerhamomyces pijperi]